MRENQKSKVVVGFHISGVFVCLFVLFVFQVVEVDVYKTSLEDISEILGNCHLALEIM